MIRNIFYVSFLPRNFKMIGITSEMEKIKTKKEEDFLYF